MIQRTSLLFSLGALNRLIKRKADRLLEKNGLTMAQFRILWFLDDNKDLCQKDLEQQFSMSKAAVSGIVDTLVEAGWLRRVKDGNDHRVKRLSLSDEGTALIKETTRSVTSLDHGIETLFTAEEKEMLEKAISRLTDFFEEKLC